MTSRLLTALAAGLPIAGISGIGYGQTTNLYWGDTHLHASYSTDAWNCIEEER